MNTSKTNEQVFEALIEKTLVGSTVEERNALVLLIKTLNTSQGELKGYNSTLYIIKQCTASYNTYEVNGNRLHTFGAGSVGEILGVAGDTFTSKNGVWICTWSKEGKKINTRANK